MNVCVFCASSPHLAPAHIDAGRRLGEWIGARRHTLLWGGCNVGLMDVVGRAAKAAGARTVAVIPRFLVDRGLAFEGADERIVTADMQSRKAELRRRADAFVALPGGIGTWEEFLEVLALRKLGQLEHPIVLANIAGYYDPFLALIAHSLEHGMSPPDLVDRFQVARSADEISGHLEAAPPAH
jgi:uncharacterized protein (TIGR00730 family)